MAAGPEGLTGAPVCTGQRHLVHPPHADEDRVSGLGRSSGSSRSVAMTKYSVERKYESRGNLNRGVTFRALLNHPLNGNHNGRVKRPKREEAGPGNVPATRDYSNHDSRKPALLPEVGGPATRPTLTPRRCRDRGNAGDMGRRDREAPRSAGDGMVPSDRASELSRLFVDQGLPKESPGRGVAASCGGRIQAELSFGCFPRSWSPIPVNEHHQFALGLVQS